MRLIKSETEIEMMRKAAYFSVQAHIRMMRRCLKLKHEYELEAEFRHDLIRNGLRTCAYEPIVGVGKNACVLHYNDNKDKFYDRELVLVDAGAEYHNYAADITRTYPINGTFTEAQAHIYQWVLKAQQTAIALIKPGLIWNELQNTIVQILTKGLIELGILEGDLETLVHQEAYKPFYMHGSGHWLGLDVHDVGAYKVNGQWRPLQAGMVLTVEPGLYISAQTPGVDPKWWDIGVRIEDDILVTETGYENLTQSLPVSIEDIEVLMRDEIY